MGNRKYGNGKIASKKDASNPALEEILLPSHEYDALYFDEMWSFILIKN